jgi:hypothetical protein
MCDRNQEISHLRNDCLELCWLIAHTSRESSQAELEYQNQEKNMYVQVNRFDSRKAESGTFRACIFANFPCSLKVFAVRDSLLKGLTFRIHKGDLLICISWKRISFYKMYVARFGKKVL